MHEETLDLATVARSLPGKPHPATVWRWYRHGLRGQRLETIVVGGRRYTSREALARFVAATTLAREAEPPAGAVAAIAAARDDVHVDRDLAKRAAEAGRRLKQLGPRGENGSA
ncbi:MAG TPA: DUF1580 domain-containing protein [Pirellulales bacterium]|nr:DUF1580 domain-containing protein [Pirellulales bacterium]